MSKFSLGQCVVVKRRNGRRIVGNIIKIAQEYAYDEDGKRVPADITAVVLDGAGVEHTICSGNNDVVQPHIAKE